MTSSRSTEERLLDTASDLFYKDGFGPTTVDKIVEGSGVSKPTLYVHFPSKSALLVATLERRHTEQVSTLDAWVRAASSDPTQQLLAVFDWLGEWHKTEGPRGCAFVNAAAELTDPTHPACEVVRRQKRWMGDYLADMATAAGLSQPARLGAELMLLVDGANARVLVEEDLHAALQARRVAAVLIEESRGRK